MPHITFPNAASARARTRAEALARSCGPVTLYWWQVHERPDGTDACVVTAAADPPKSSGSAPTTQRPAWLDETIPDQATAEGPGAKPTVR